MAAFIRPTSCSRAATSSYRTSPFLLTISRQLFHPLQQRQQQRRSLATETTTSTSTSKKEATVDTPSPSPSSSPSATSQSSTTKQTKFPPLPYHIHRTPSQQLPIYQLAKAGGNKHQTRIRKISGDAAALKQDLIKALHLDLKDIAVNSINGHILIKGWRKSEVAKFLQGKSF